MGGVEFVVKCELRFMGFAGWEKGRLDGWKDGRLAVGVGNPSYKGWLLRKRRGSEFPPTDCTGCNEPGDSGQLREFVAGFFKMRDLKVLMG